VLELYDHQKAMQEPMRERKNALLPAPCGSGKTLAVVYSWLKERPTKHLIYVLPTTTLLKSIKQDIIELIEGKESKPNVVKELGYRIVDLELTEFSNPKLISIATDYGEERESKLRNSEICLLPAFSIQPLFLMKRRCMITIPIPWRVIPLNY